MDSYWRKQFLWMLKIELEGPYISPDLYRALVAVGEPLYFPARRPQDPISRCGPSRRRPRALGCPAGVLVIFGGVL